MKSCTFPFTLYSLNIIIFLSMTLGVSPLFPKLQISVKLSCHNSVTSSLSGVGTVALLIGQQQIVCHSVQVLAEQVGHVIHVGHPRQREEISALRWEMSSFGRISSICSFFMREIWFSQTKAASRQEGTLEKGKPLSRVLFLQWQYFHPEIYE